MDIRLLPTDKFIDALDRELAVPPGRGAKTFLKVGMMVKKTFPNKLPGPCLWLDKEGFWWEWTGKQWTLRDDIKA